MLRAVGGQDLTMSLGAAMGAIFETPMWTGLLGQQWELAGAGLEGFTEEQTTRMREAEFARHQETQNLEAELQWSTDDRRDEITLRLEELNKQPDIQLQAETQRSIDEGRMQTPENLAEQYGDLGLTFDRAMSNEEAQLLADNKKAELIRQAIISKGPSGVLPTVAMFGAGLANMATDPLEVASMFIPVVGVGGRAAAVARFGKVGGRVAVGAVEGLVGSALTEPFYYTLSRQQQLDYTMSDALLNIGLGTVFGGGIGAIGGVLARADIPVAARVDGEPVRVKPPEAAPRVKEGAFQLTPEMRVKEARVLLLTPEMRAKIEPIPPLRRIESETSLRQFVNDQPVNVSRVSTDIEVPQSSGVAIPYDEWSAGNMVVDERGVAIQLFHGAGEPFKVFDVTRGAERFDGSSGIFLISRRGLAVEHALRGKTPTVIKAEASIKNPVEVSSGTDSPDTYWLRNSLKLEGDVKRGDNDGIIIRADDGEHMVIAIDPDQVRIVKDDIPKPSLDTAAQLAENAQISRLSDPEAARVYDEYAAEDFTGDAAINEDIQMYDTMVKQIEEDLTPDQRAMLDEVTEIETKAKAYADLSRVAATCMART